MTNLISDKRKSVEQEGTRNEKSKHVNNNRTLSVAPWIDIC